MRVRSFVLACVCARGAHSQCVSARVSSRVRVYYCGASLLVRSMSAPPVPRLAAHALSPTDARVTFTFVVGDLPVGLRAHAIVHGMEVMVLMARGVMKLPFLGVVGDCSREQWCAALACAAAMSDDEFLAGLIMAEGERSESVVALVLQYGVVLAGRLASCDPVAGLPYAHYDAAEAAIRVGLRVAAREVHRPDVLARLVVLEHALLVGVVASPPLEAIVLDISVFVATMRTFVRISPKVAVPFLARMCEYVWFAPYWDRVMSAGDVCPVDLLPGLAEPEEP